VQAYLELLETSIIGKANTRSLPQAIYNSVVRDWVAVPTYFRQAANHPLHRNQ